MQEYLQKSRLGEAMDALGFRFLALIVCLGWFLLVWGACAPALAAGGAMFFLILIAEKKTRDGRLKRKEKRLRIRIGGELKLEKLLLSPPRQAHFETAMLLSLRHPLALQQTFEEGVLCDYKDEKLLISFAQLPVSDQVKASHVLSLQRFSFHKKADRALLCAPCPISESAREQARGEMPVTFFGRDSLITLFGENNPATDAQLIALGKRKRAGKPLRLYLSVIFHPARGKRYVLYGGLLLLLYFLTRLPFYAFPAVLCFFLAAGCRCRREKKEIL